VSRLEVIAGPMFSGKSDELIRRISTARIACLQAEIFRPRIDTRTTEEIVISRSGARSLARVVGSAEELYEQSCPFAVVGIDEAQFFNFAIYGVVERLVGDGKRVILAGLDLDYTGSPYGPMPGLLAMADRVDKLTAVCHKCYSMDATRTQRLVDGLPAIRGAQTVIDRFDKYVLDGTGVTTYEARCLNCYQPPA